jgi:flagellar protein FlaG
MSPDQQPTNIQLAKRDDYRDNYANSVQVRMTMWDFFLTFGVMSDANSERVLIEAFQGVYLSPQQAKALANILNQNIVQYESAFGEIRLEPQSSAGVIQ